MLAYVGSHALVAAECYHWHGASALLPVAPTLKGSSSFTHTCRHACTQTHTHTRSRTCEAKGKQLSHSCTNNWRQHWGKLRKEEDLVFVKCLYGSLCQCSFSVDVNVLLHFNLFVRNVVEEKIWIHKFTLGGKKKDDVSWVTIWVFISEGYWYWTASCLKVMFRSSNWNAK